MEVSHPLPVHLSVSIVLHNSSEELLQRALHSLHRSAGVAQQAGCLGRVSVSVVDNSADRVYQQQIVGMLAAGPQCDFFRVHYSAQPLNRGFGPGHNSVIQSLDSDFHLVLNPDAELEVDTLCNGLSCINQDDSIVNAEVRHFVFYLSYIFNIREIGHSLRCLDEAYDIN